MSANPASCLTSILTRKRARDTFTEVKSQEELHRAALESMKSHQELLRSALRKATITPGRVPLELALFQALDNNPYEALTLDLAWILQRLGKMIVKTWYADTRQEKDLCVTLLDLASGMHS